MLAVSIPVGIVLLSFLRSVIEYYFRYSKPFHWVYTIGDTLGLLAQLVLFLLSVLLFFHLVLIYKEYEHTVTWLLTTAVSLIPGLYVVVQFML